MTATTTHKGQPAMPARPAPQELRAADGPAGFYKQQRSRGFSHDEAIRAVCQTFGYHGQETNVERWLADARRDFEAPELPAAQRDELPEKWKSRVGTAGGEWMPEPESEPEIDGFDARTAELLSEKGQLEVRVDKLRLDAFEKRAGAADELAKVKQRLAAIDESLADLEPVPRARAKRERQAAEEATRKDREQAFKQVRALDAQRNKHAAGVDRAADAFAAAVAAHRKLGDRQAELLIGVGIYKEPALPIVGPYERTLRRALRAADCDGELRWGPGHLDADMLTPLAPAEKDTEK